VASFSLYPVADTRSAAQDAVDLRYERRQVERDDVEEKRKIDVEAGVHEPVP